MLVPGAKEKLRGLLRKDRCGAASECHSNAHVDGVPIRCQVVEVGREHKVERDSAVFLISQSFYFELIYLLRVCVCVVCVPWHKCGGQSTVCKSWPSSSTEWVSGIRLSSVGRCFYLLSHLTGSGHSPIGNDPGSQ